MPRPSKPDSWVLEDDDKYMIECKELKKARKELGLTLAKAARLCNVTTATLSRWEQGLVDPTFDQLTMLEDMFGFEAGELVLCGDTRSRLKKRAEWKETLEDVHN